MAVTGGIKFFERSKCLASDDAEGSASSGDASVERALDRNPVSYWRSVSSNDTVTETITITFDSDKTINRLLLLDHNWKSYNVKYDVSGVWTHFASVVGVNGVTQSNITETVYPYDSSYYEFTEVTTGAIQIEVTTTQVADAQKYINQIIATKEIGTLVGYPEIKGGKLSRNSREKQMLSGKYLTLKSEESFMVDLSFSNYPRSLSADVDLIFSLYDLETPFLVWICGGRTGSDYFGKQLRTFRLKDVYQVQTAAEIDPDYSQNVYQNSVNFTVKLKEAVD